MQLNKDEETLRWLAGFFDGEGHVTISYSKHTGKRQDRSFYLMVGISQKREDILLALKAMYGAGTIAKTNGSAKQWVVGNKVAETFLLDIQPYLKLKNLAVAVALGYRLLVGSHIVGRKGKKGRELAPGIKDKMMALRDALIEVNARD